MKSLLFTLNFVINVIKNCKTKVIFLFITNLFNNL